MPISPLQYLPTLQQSPLQGSNLPMILKQLSQQKSSMAAPQGQQQQAGQQQGDDSGLGKNSMFGGQQPNQLAPGGSWSPFDSYTNASGDLMSGGQVTPG